MTIRAGNQNELKTLQEIERSAGRAFVEIGMVEIAADEPLSEDRLREYCEAQRLWVYDDGEGKVVAYLVADVLDGCAHIEQVSVHAAFAGRRLGRALIEHLVQWARLSGLAGVTLTTFADVPWNARYYVTCGFTTIAPEQLGPELRAVRAREAKQGLDRWPRVAMYRGLD